MKVNSELTPRINHRDLLQDKSANLQRTRCCHGTGKSGEQDMVPALSQLTLEWRRETRK